MYPYSKRIVVNPNIISNERWWTVLFGILAILNGLKSLVRWTQFSYPVPFFGIMLSGYTAVIALIISGIIEFLIGVAALKLRKIIFPLAGVYYGIWLISDIISLPIIPKCAESYVKAKRAFQGLYVRPGEIEIMQKLMPILMIIAPIIFLLWAFFVFLKARKVNHFDFYKKNYDNEI